MVWLRNAKPSVSTDSRLHSSDARRKEAGAGQEVPLGVQVSVDELIRLRLRARSINLESRSQATSALAGVHQSRFRGRGIDFQESRYYQPGDDIRNMDWRVTARSGRPHTKLFREERERPVIVMLELGLSMFFGSRVAFKSVTAARVAALIGWATVQNGDRIGALLFGSGTHHEIPPAGGRRGVLRVLRQLTSWLELERTEARDGLSEGGAKDGLSEALKRLRRVSRPGSLVFILSDFYSVDSDTERQLARLRQHNDVVACQILDTLELVPPPPGRYGITDGHRIGILDTSAKASREIYSTYFAKHQKMVRELMRKRGIRLLQLVTHEDIVDGLRRGLANRVTATATAPSVESS